MLDNYSFTRVLWWFIIGSFMMVILSVAGCTQQEQGSAPSAQPPVPSSQQVVQEKYYDLETAKIEFAVTGDFPRGTEVYYFKNWGLQEAVISQVEGSSVKGISIRDRDMTYTFSASDNEGLKMPADQTTLWRADSKKEFAVFINDAYAAQGYVKGGTSIVAGKECDIWQHESMPVTLCIWKGVVLRADELEEGQVSITEAVSVDENPTIPTDTFTIPSDIKFNSLEESS